MCHKRYRPACLERNFAENNRIATRELLLSLGASELAITTTPENPDKIHKIRVAHVLREIRSPAHARELARAMINGDDLPPIQVQEMRFKHMLYYVPIDGNHRAAAACYIEQEKVEAQIVSHTDLSNVPFGLNDLGYVVVGTKLDGVWKITSLEIETELDKAVFETMFHLQNYDHIRKKELESHGA